MRRKIVYGLAILWLGLFMVRLVSDGDGLDAGPAAVALAAVTITLAGFGVAALITRLRGRAREPSSPRPEAPDDW